MRTRHENFKISQIKKWIVSAETIHGNMLFILFYIEHYILKSRQFFLIHIRYYIENILQIILEKDFQWYDFCLADIRMKFVSNKFQDFF
jgi:hypothetical protein